MKLQRRNLLLCPTRFSPQRLTPNLHPAEGKPFLAQVLQRGPDRIDGVVEAEEVVMGECWNVSSFATGHNL